MSFFRLLPRSLLFQLLNLLLELGRVARDLGENTALIGLGVDPALLQELAELVYLP